jgi:hypothetical protein
MARAVSGPMADYLLVNILLSKHVSNNVEQGFEQCHHSLRREQYEGEE